MEAQTTPQADVGKTLWYYPFGTEDKVTWYELRIRSRFPEFKDNDDIAYVPIGWVQPGKGE
jgi:hypothetical protein